MLKKVNTIGIKPARNKARSSCSSDLLTQGRDRILFLQSYFLIFKYNQNWFLARTAVFTEHELTTNCLNVYTMYILVPPESCAFFAIGKQHLLRCYGLHISLICDAPSRLASAAFGWPKSTTFKCHEYIQTKGESVCNRTSRNGEIVSAYVSP